jgi:hypothetical protein
MKKTLNKLILFFLVLISALPANAQYSFPKEKAKYWLYRERLKNFMVRSNGVAVCRGCDILANNRGANDPPDLDLVEWADTPWFVGYWIGTLAMEYQLLINSGLSDSSPEVMQTKADLYGAIQSINRLDYEAEESWHCPPCNTSTYPCPTYLNGFLLNDNIPSNFAEALSIIDQLNGGAIPPPDNFRDLCIASAYTAYETPREASGDHLIGLFMGLTLVKKCVPPNVSWGNTKFTDEYFTPASGTVLFVKEVQIISNRIVTYLNSHAWIYRNACNNECVQGVTRPRNPNACTNPGVPDECHIEIDCCQQGGALASFHAIGFAATNRFIQGTLIDTILNQVIWNPYYRAQWNAALVWSAIKDNRLPVILAALGNMWMVKPCPPGTPVKLCGSKTWQVSDHLVNRAKRWVWEDLYLTHKLFYGGGITKISNEHYECLLNAAPCRAYDGSNSLLPDGSLPLPNVEWSNTDRIKGQRGTFYSSAFSRVDYMYLFNLYNLSNPSSSSYGPIPIKQLAPYTLVKQNYTEYDLKNFMAVNIIGKAGTSAYKVSSDAKEGKGRVTFAAGKNILLAPGFEATPGSYFHGYIDPAISSMTCADPSSIGQTDCVGSLRLVSGSLDIDTLADTDSIISSDPPVRAQNMILAGDDITSQDNLQEQSKISITPNPSTGIFTLFSSNELSSIEVVNYLGTRVYNKTLNTVSGNIDVDISTSPPGIYLVKVISGDKVISKKVIKQ